MRGRECKTKTSHLLGGGREYEYLLELHIIGILLPYLLSTICFQTTESVLGCFGLFFQMSEVLVAQLQCGIALVSLPLQRRRHNTYLCNCRRRSPFLRPTSPMPVHGGSHKEKLGNLSRKNEKACFKMLCHARNACTS